MLYVMPPMCRCGALRRVDRGSFQTALASYHRRSAQGRCFRHTATESNGKRQSFATSAIDHRVVVPACEPAVSTAAEPSRSAILRSASTLPNLHHAWVSTLLVFSTINTLLLPSWALAKLPPEPQIGDCTDCLGEVNGALNACPLDSPSCVSSENDDADHFLAPWTFDTARPAAIDELVRVATGGEYEQGLVQEPFGIRRADAAKWILGTTANFVLGKPLPEKPVRQKSVQAVERFDGRLVDRHTASDGSEYLHFVFGEQAEVKDEGGLDSQVLDAEFTFLPDDAVVNVRSSSRVDPSVGQTKLSLSFQYGVELDQNVARRRMEQLRKALHWESLAVISDFDPKFNNDPLWFEKFYEPFKIEPPPQ